MINIDAKEMLYYSQNSVKYGKIPNTVYHFCSTETFFKIINSSSIRLCNITKSNDSEEITYIIPYLIKSLRIVVSNYNCHLGSDYQISNESIDAAVSCGFTELIKNFYVICFSEVGSLLSQWARYANDATGVSIGFNTSHFINLQAAPYTGYVFGQVVYDVSSIEKKIFDMVSTQIESRWVSGNHAHNHNVIADCISNIIGTFTYYSILYKNPFFQEEQEWRLIYNPFGRMRHIMEPFNYFDRITDVNQSIDSSQGFIRRGIELEYGKGNIRSFYSLDFSDIKQSLINEVIIGPASSIDANDKDLSLFFKQMGYICSHTGLKGTIRVSKVIAPYKQRNM